MEGEAVYLEELYLCRQRFEGGGQVFETLRNRQQADGLSSCDPGALQDYRA